MRDSLNHDKLNKPPSFFRTFLTTSSTNDISLLRTTREYHCHCCSNDDSNDDDDLLLLSNCSGIFCLAFRIIVGVVETSLNLKRGDISIIFIASHKTLIKRKMLIHRFFALIIAFVSGNERWRSTSSSSRL